MKMLLFIPGLITSAVLTLSATSNADPLGGGNLGGGFHRGHHADMGFTRGSGIRRNSAFHPAFPLNQTRRFFRRDRRFVFQRFVWPGYWYPYQDLDDYSYLDYGPDDNYQYWDNSAAPTLPESSRPAVDRNPMVVVIKTSDSGPVGSSRNPAYSSVDPAWQQKIVVQDPNERIGPRADPGTVVPQTPQTVAKGTQTRPPAQAGAFGNFVLVSWLEEAGKDVIYIQNTETNDVQKITSEPNLDNFRIVVLHRNPDPKLFEAVISNGSQQGPVRFRF
jgi:hypothetical protein